MRPEWKNTIRLCIFAVLFIAACWYCIPRLQAQAEVSEGPACAAEITSIYALRINAGATAEGVTRANQLVFTSTRYLEAIGSPEYTLYINEEQPVELRQYWLAYASRADRDNLIVMRWSDARMFGPLVIIGELPNGEPDYLHLHPDCSSGTMRRVDLEALLADAVPRPTPLPITPPSAEAIERERVRLLRVEAKIACARVEAWYINHETSAGLIEAQEACRTSQAALAVSF